MRVLVLCVLVVVVLNVCVCEALDVETRALGKCGAGEHLAQGRALANGTLFSAVSKWAHEKEPVSWAYEEEAHASAELLALFSVSGAEAAALKCVRVNYTATIELPGAFSSLLSLIGVPEPVPIRVDKVVCHAEDVLLEDTRIETPVVGHVTMQARHNLYNSVDVVSTAHTVLELPWYATPFSSQASGALSQRLKEKFTAIVLSLCEGEGVLLRRIRPTPTNSSFGEKPARVGVRRFPLTRSSSAPLETLSTLGRVDLRRVGRSASAL